MHWSAMLVLAAGAGTAVGGVGMETSIKAPTFNSYTEAYHAAGDVKMPMFVVLNPPAGATSARKPISIDELRRDPKTNEVLEDYVVAVIDTGTEHGRKVHALFESKALPRVVVIDDQQNQQVFRTSRTLAQAELRTVLERYRNGAAPVTTAVTPAQFQPSAPANCPNCRRY